MLILRGVIDSYQLGGKGFHLKLLEQGQFNIPKTYFPDELDKLQNEVTYVVRSSSAEEDGQNATAAGKYLTLKGVRREDVISACKTVKSHYVNGSVVIQPDLSNVMEFSGVLYTNLNGKTIISGGFGSYVQKIVEGVEPETEISITYNKISMSGKAIKPSFIDKLKETSNKIESYFGIPMDVEFAIINDDVTILQARPLPNPTIKSLRENELRRVRKKINQNGIEEIVLGVGNYREILGNTDATQLSTSFFNYIFSGDGKNMLGGMQLGRNELGYDIGTEIAPWVIMTGGKVYYNFAGDAFQFRPNGLSKKDLQTVINKYYLPMINGNPDLLNYPELRMYIQFPEQAEVIGVNPEPYKILVEKNRNALRKIVSPKEPPKKRTAEHFNSLEDCLDEINLTADNIRVGTAREYSKAARLAFFALEDVHEYIIELEKIKPEIFNNLCELFGKTESEQLRDTIVYDESIASFEVEETEEFKYLGSFELTAPRSYPPKRKFKKGEKIPEAGLEELVKVTRNVLGYREKVKFSLFKDYDYLKQLFGQLEKRSNLGSNLYYLEYSELPLLKDVPILAKYRIGLRKGMKKSNNIFPDPIFFSDMEQGVIRTIETKPHLVFGSLEVEDLLVTVGNEAYVVNSVDQTVSIPEGTQVVLVPNNVRPGSHLFTVLSDYGLPVIGIQQSELDNLKGSEIFIQDKGDYVNLRRKK